jgi:uncharacterized membrane-anchored protein
MWLLVTSFLSEAAVGSGLIFISASAFVGMLRMFQMPFYHYLLKK